MKAYLGVDVGSVSTNFVLMDETGHVLESLYIRTMGQPIQAIQDGLKKLGQGLPPSLRILGAGTTGSARQLSGVIIGADIVKNEITAHAVAALHCIPDVQTVMEIGGQDSKLIVIRDGIVVDFAMNTVCSAGTGSFLDQQAGRLGIPIEEFGALALKSKHPVRIAGRCSVFAESDMIHKQQMGHSTSDIVAGLCDALVRNYLNNVGKGKSIAAPVIFQGGVAANLGIRNAFEKELQLPITVPEHFDVMGALGMAILAKEAVARSGKTSFRGFAASELEFTSTSFECSGCANRCEIVEIKQSKAILARWGDRCRKWQDATTSSEVVAG
ncbi:MAG: 2-hydroxyglutaryl-CoA dehydratase [Firmicutes bacterium]|nr:2-hydroxyglutaryl-CoA dehydratase [Bacillota bacterium]